MATFRQRRAQMLLDLATLLTTDFEHLAERIRLRILSYGSTAGDIPASEWARLDMEVAALVYGYLLGAIVATPFRIGADGQFIPQSDYARRYDDAVRQATELALEEQAALLRRIFPADVERRLRAARFSPLSRLDMLQEEVRALFEDFTPQYAVVRADNKALLDRMLNVAADTRRKLSLLLNDLLGRQMSAREIGETVTQFMTEGLKVQNQIYGTKGIFDSLRLLLSEATFAHARAGVLAAALNPAVKQVEVYLSPRHREIDGCDDIVAGNPYSLKDAPVPPYHSSCGCGLRFVTTRSKGVIEAIRDSGLLSIKGALAPEFADILLRGR